MSKYHSTKIRCADGVFDSKREYKRWMQLKDLEKAGFIFGLQRQVPFLLIPKMKLDTPRPSLTGSRTIRAEKEVKYYADFVYRMPDGTQVVEDTKGMRTAEYIIKRKLMKHIHNIEITEI